MTITAAGINRDHFGPPYACCRSLWLAPLLQLVATALFILSGCSPSGPKPLDGKLTVLVRPADRKIDPVPLEQAGSLPVQSGGAMVLDAQMSEPAFMYFVWLDAEGQVLPLYPWNNETLEVKDIDEPPPVRRAGKLVFSPLLGRVWTFGNRGGSETVLLLARRTPLPAETKLGSLIQSPPSGKAAASSETGGAADKSFTSIQITPAATVVSVVKDGIKAEDTATIDDPSLRTLLDRLRTHFDLIHAIQFVHRAATAETDANSAAERADR